MESNMDSINNSKRKRRRTQNTSDEQYIEYLNVMEQDYIFRSGIINPTLPNDYITNKWKILSNTLNSIGKGPQLTPEEWRKRFNDWKNATRSKYKKLHEYRNQTGGGPKNQIEMTDIEERGLAVWGKVTVKGTSVVPEVGGLPSNIYKDSVTVDSVISAINIPDIDNTNASCSTNNIENEATVSAIVTPSDELQFSSNSDIIIEKTDNLDESENSERKNKTRPKPINEVASSLLKTYESSLNINQSVNNALQLFVENYVCIEQK